MYLKRLQVHGFKSFATRTVLEFSPGATAIVGPNGSGKSNIADGLRWVLGEQSMRQLRGKKSDDIIFAGGHGRAPLGMAEVTLTLDNASNWLPSDFSEVTVTRRSFRTGESEYLINNTKVRLKDVLALLSQARIGHDSYTIIGQGLVDQALSARAEERRGLFEDAAGIRHFQAQRNEAEQRLTQTHVNLSRLHDILSEIEPRLGPLAEQARRAQEYIITRADLDRLLHQWFSHQWGATHQKMMQAEATEALTNARMDALRDNLASQDTKQQELRTQREQFQVVIGDLRRQRGEAGGKLQALERDRAVAQERAASLERSRQEMTGEQARVTQTLESAAARIIQLESELAATDDALDTGSVAIAELESAIHRARQHQEREDARLRAVQRDAMQAAAKVTASQAEIARFTKQLGDKQQNLALRRANTEQAQARADVAQAKLEQVRAAHETQRADLGDKLIEREGLIQYIAEAQVQQETCRGELADAKRARVALADRLALLHEMLANAGDSAAALAAIAAVPEDDRPTILGTLADVVRSAPEYETAIEAALGPNLQALVAASEDDGWRCAQVLRAAGVGRTRILWPVEGAERGGETSSPVLPVAGGELRFTALLDQGDPAVVAIVRMLVGELAVIELDDGAELRWQMQAAPVITVAGEIAHPSGWLEVGHATGEKQEGVLARARALRELPDEIDSADLLIHSQEGLFANARAAVEQGQAEKVALDRDIKGREAKLSEEAKVLGQAQRDAEKLGNEAHLSDAVLQQLAGEILNLEEEIAAAHQRQSEADAMQRDAAFLLDEVQAEVEEAVAVTRAQAEDLAKRRTALAVQRQEQKALTQQIAQAQGQLRELTAQVDQRGARLVDLERQGAEVAVALARQATELEVVRVLLRDLTGQLQVLEAEAAAIDQHLGAIDTSQAAGRVELTQAEGDYRKALLEAQRARDAIEVLRTQMLDEMGEDEAHRITERDADATEVIPPEEYTKMRRTIDNLRGRMKSLGGYDPEAPQAYEELKTRYEFLNAQVRDMEEASARLRAVIMDLDLTMRKRFEETFQMVNERFRVHFTTLFQGGTARLELTAPKRTRKDDDEDDGEDDTPDIGVNKRGMTGGVEVYVQIPGKKVQDLGLLSGGERAMVSAALLFALLETNPPPFCLLDEVDAALDESNVVRFCDILGTLAQLTQFIIITHNRVTMTHANVIYGVSMTESVSRILSMRLAEAQSA